PSLQNSTPSKACRGEALDDGVEVDSAQEPLYCSFSHYLSTFCSLLEEEGLSNLELTRLMTRLSHRVAYTFEAKGQKYGGKKEMPCLLTRLTREVFPFGDLKEDNNASRISATSMVASHKVRTRIASLS
ncbi:hypothetical protein XENOCAPTIV_028497, partial [Xenoophorus captivus]